MKYSIEEKTVDWLVNLIENKSIDLNPSYQRNFIWSPNDQKELIDTIILNLPLPSFFLYLMPNGKYEMIDGQQRSKTIHRFVKGILTSSKSTGALTIKDINILDYRLPIIIITDLTANDDLKNFYVLINKKGKHLNKPEVYKSEFHDTNFLKLSNEILTNQKFIELNLFTEASSKRMNDRAFVEELLGYLLVGIKDKKNHIEQIYKEDIVERDIILLETTFNEIITVIHEFNKIKPIKNTRYKQKNDFFTLFNFVKENINMDLSLLKYQYQILLILDGKDDKGRQFIRPTNEDCPPLQNYATNCVSQSNSKKARESRLNFFNEILKNQELENNENLIEVTKYLESIYGENSIEFLNFEGFEIINTTKILIP